ALESQILIKTKIAGLPLQLTPLACLRRHVSGWLEHFGNHDFVLGLHASATVIASHPGAKSVATAEKLRARRSTKRLRIALLKPDPALGESMYVRFFKIVGLKTAEFSDPKTTREKKNVVSLRTRRICRLNIHHGGNNQNNQKDESFHELKTQTCFHS